MVRLKRLKRRLYILELIPSPFPDFFSQFRLFSLLSLSLSFYYYIGQAKHSTVAAHWGFEYWPTLLLSLSAAFTALRKSTGTLFFVTRNVCEHSIPFWPFLLCILLFHLQFCTLVFFSLSLFFFLSTFLIDCQLPRSFPFHFPGKSSWVLVLFRYLCLKTLQVVSVRTIVLLFIFFLSYYY